MSMLMIPDAIKASIGFLMYDTSRQLRGRFDAHARALGVTRQQWRVLLMLAHDDGPTQTEVADQLEVERITLCRMIDRLAEAGLVQRREDPSDRRVWRLHLLPAAYPIVEQMTAIGATMEAETMALLGADAPAFRDNLARLRDGLRDDTKRSVA